MEEEDSNEEILEHFRLQWQQEIASSSYRFGRLPPIQENPLPANTTSSQCCPYLPKENVDTPDIEDKAKDMFLEGVKLEETGKVVEAIRFYKRAMQLVPDIEQRIYTATKNREGNSNKEQYSDDTEEETESESEDNEVSAEEENDEGNEKHGGVMKKDLLVKFKKVIQREGLICKPQEDQKATHISVLPCEIIVYLLKWVVSSDLDLRSLEQVSLVCRGFYVCSRDVELWKLVCVRVWNSDCGLPQSYGYQTWREMYISRPRLHFNGCYISKTTYVRPGENSFQDVDYQPWHLVTYFRYIRFFPEGLAVMLTTAEEPSITVSHLKRHGGKHSSLLRGQFTLGNNNVKVIFKRKAALPNNNQRFRRRRDENNNDGSTIAEQIFELELEIRSHKHRLHYTLYWQRYCVRTVYLNGEQTVTPYDISPARFPSLWFSRVRSYTAESERPL